MVAFTARASCFEPRDDLLCHLDRRRTTRRPSCRSCIRLLCTLSDHSRSVRVWRAGSATEIEVSSRRTCQNLISPLSFRPGKHADIAALLAAVISSSCLSDDRCTPTPSPRRCTCTPSPRSTNVWPYRLRLGARNPWRWQVHEFFTYKRVWVERIYERQTYTEASRLAVSG